MAYMKWGDFKKKIDKIIPDDYLLKSTIKIIIEPEKHIVYIEAKNEN